MFLWKVAFGFACSYSPEHLVQEDVIVVTFNYRLSALGFLYLPEAGIYGNAALKDQVSVLMFPGRTPPLIRLCFMSSAVGTKMGSW